MADKARTATSEASEDRSEAPEPTATGAFREFAILVAGLVVRERPVIVAATAPLEQASDKP